MGSILPAFYDHPNIPFHELRDYNSPYHDFRGFYGQYSINPYYILDNQVVKNNVDNILSSFSLNYKISDHLSLTGKISTNFFISTVTENNPKFRYERALSYSDGELSDFNSARESFSLGSYKEASTRNTDIIYDLFATYNTNLGSDFKWTLTGGFNSIDQATRRVAGTTVGGLVIPGFYDLSNSAQTPISATLSSKYRLFGAILNTQLGFRNYLFAEYSARNDWSSTLPKGSNDFFYQGGGISFVPSSLPNWNSNTISYLKFRAGLGSSGKDAPLYRLESYYSLNPTILDWGDDYKVLFPFGDVAGAQRLNRIGNPNLKPELSVTTEAGVDIGLFDDRVTIEYTYYIVNSKNQIVDVNIPWSTGFSIVPQNIGRMENKGHELSLRLTPVKTENFDWKVFGTWSKNKNIVKTILDNGVEGDELNIYTGLVHFAGHGSLNLVAAEGQPFGTYKGTGFVYDDQGHIVVDGVGNPVRSAESKYIGSYQPDFLYSIGSDFRFRNFNLHILLDGRKGGLFYSGTRLSTEFNGTASSTVIDGKRENFVVPNSVVSENGTYVTNTQETSVYSYFRGLPAEHYLIDATYLKLREISLSYNLPNEILGVKGFKDVTIGVFAKNLKYWVAKDNTFADPEVGGVGASSDAVGIETSTTPSSASYGAELRFKF